MLLTNFVDHLLILVWIYQQSILAEKTWFFFPLIRLQKL